MSLESQIKHLMDCQEKIKRLRKEEEQARRSVISWLQNHQQAGVTFKHNDKRVTLMVESAAIRKYSTEREKEKKIEDILLTFSSSEHPTDINATSKEILNKLKSVKLDKKDVLKVKCAKI